MRPLDDAPHHPSGRALPADDFGPSYGSIVRTFGIIQHLSPRVILRLSSAQEGRQASVNLRSRMQGSPRTGFTSGGAVDGPSRFTCPDAPARQADGPRPGGKRSRPDPWQVGFTRLASLLPEEPARGGFRGGAARKGRRRNFIRTNAQALPRTAPHPLATMVACCLTSTGAGCGGRGNYYVRNPLLPAGEGGRGATG